MEIVDVDPFLEYVDPVLRTALPVLPPPILPGYHHDAAGIENGMQRTCLELKVVLAR